MDWDTLQAACTACTKCELCSTRTHVVFGQGARNAEVLFVGEGPGQNEDEQGLPFVGRSGQLLDKYLFAIDLDRKTNCYIANIVKCRPPQNRDPLPAESEACMPWLREQFRLLQPKIVVCLGRIAAQRKKRHPVYGHLPPRCPSARAAEQAQRFCGFCGTAGKDPGSVSAHLRSVILIGPAGRFPRRRIQAPAPSICSGPCRSVPCTLSPAFA